MRLIRRALVTGGAGFIGSNLVRALVDAGIRVSVLDDLSTGRAENLSGLDVAFTPGDIRRGADVQAAIRRCDTVFHLAASVGNQRSLRQPLSDADVNVLGTITVLEAAREHRVERLIMSSSAGIFGEPRFLPVTEDHPSEPDSPYGATKLAGEKLCLAYGKLYDLECVCLRYFNVYGPGQHYDAYGNAIPIFVRNLLRSEILTIFGDGEQTRDFVSIHDVVQANVQAASVESLSGVFNIASGKRTSINQLVSLLGEVAGTKVEVRHEAPRPGDVRDSCADVNAARRQMGYEPGVPLRRGLTEYMGWAVGNLA